jgi:hypothetical protein
MPKRKRTKPKRLTKRRPRQPLVFDGVAAGGYKSIAEVLELQLAMGYFVETVPGIDIWELDEVQEFLATQRADTASVDIVPLASSAPPASR